MSANLKRKAPEEDEPVKRVPTKAEAEDSEGEDSDGEQQVSSSLTERKARLKRTHTVNRRSLTSISIFITLTISIFTLSKSY